MAVRHLYWMALKTDLCIHRTLMRSKDHSRVLEGSSSPHLLHRRYPNGRLFCMTAVLQYCCLADFPHRLCRQAETGCSLPSGSHSTPRVHHRGYRKTRVAADRASCCSRFLISSTPRRSSSVSAACESTSCPNPPSPVPDSNLLYTCDPGGGTPDGTRGFPESPDPCTYMRRLIALEAPSTCSTKPLVYTARLNTWSKYVSCFVRLR